MVNPSTRRDFGFMDYLHVMRRLGRFWTSVALCLTTLIGAILTGRVEQALLGFAIGVGAVGAYFPVWRWLAVKHPGLATEWQPELLSDGPRDVPMHPAEPLSNVRPLDAKDG